MTYHLQICLEVTKCSKCLQFDKDGYFNNRQRKEFIYFPQILETLLTFRCQKGDINPLKPTGHVMQQPV